MMQLFVLYSRNGQLLSMVCAVFSKKAAMTVRVFTANIPTIVGIYHTFIYSSERVVFLVRVTTQAIFLEVMTTTVSDKNVLLLYARRPIQDLSLSRNEWEDPGTIQLEV